MRARLVVAALLSLLVSATEAFLETTTPKSVATRQVGSDLHHVQYVFQAASSSRLFMSSSSDDNSKQKSKLKSGLDENMRNKLLTESIAPWRTLRLFLYFSAGSGAFIGGLITLSGFIAAMTAGGGENVDVNTELLNLGIDFGAVAIFAALAKFDLDKQGELDQSVQEKVELKKAQQKVVKSMRERERNLGTLELEIKVSAGGDTRQASVKQLQAGARQHMIIVVGPKKACKDALIGANLLKMDFAMSNVLVVPYETDVDEAELQSKPTGSGFGELPVYESQPYVARPVGDGWADYVAAEIDDAVKQNGENARTEGIAIVLANNGKVIRRGVGKVPWRQMVEQLEAEVKTG